MLTLEKIKSSKIGCLFRTDKNLEELRYELQLSSLYYHYNSLEISLILIENVMMPPKKVQKGRKTSKSQTDTSKKRIYY